jgi:hypothetical protein
MPTFDGGHYFLTVLLPVRTQTIKDGDPYTSPVHALRKRLALLPPAAQTPACYGQQSPFARNTRSHFARFAVIDDVAYNGREQQNTLLSQARGTNLQAAQHQDHLACPFLLFTVDFDAASGSDSERDSYLTTLWETMGDDLAKIFVFCVGFEPRVKDAASFAKYIAGCQIETTMSFNDYYISDPLDPRAVNPLSQLPTWPASDYAWGAKLASAPMLIGLLVALFWPGGGLILLGAGLTALAIVAWRAYASIMSAGEKPLPAAPDSNLPAVLKALHLQRVFTRFAIDHQMLAASVGGGDELHAAFQKFLAEHQPGNLDGPTQQPGVIGI